MIRAGGASFFFALVLTNAVRADEFFVATADEFHAQIKAAHPGDVITLASGPWRDVELVVDAKGTSALPITVRAEEPGKVTISGNSRLRIAGSHVVVSGLRFRDAWHKSALIEFRRDSKRPAVDCRLTDCEVVDCNPPDLQDRNEKPPEFKYLSIYGRSNAVDHCRFQGKTNRGTTLVVWLDDGGDEEESDWGGHVICNNHFGPRPELGRNGGETIRIGDSATAQFSAKTTVAGNLFEECNGEGEIVSNKSCDNHYRGNVFLRCSGALTLRHGHRCLVERNLFLGEKARGSGGVRIIGSDHVVINNYFERLEGDDMRSALCVMNGILDSPANGYDPVERAIVAHNTFYDCKRTILIGRENDAKSQVAPKDCLFANNVIVSRRGPMIDLRSGDQIQWLQNHCFGDGELGITQRPGVQRFNDSPLEKQNDRWTLFEGSLLVNAGAVTPELPKTDLLGRVRDDSPDVGCDEWPTGDIAQIREVNVGPTWSQVNLFPK